MGIKPARPWAIAAALAEFVGGLLVAFGFLGPIGYLAVCGSMLAAIWLVHAGKGFFSSKGGWEFPLMILAVLAGTSLIGPGAISLDHLLGVALPEPTTWLVMALLVLIGVGATLLSTKLQQARQAKPQVA